MISHDGYHSGSAMQKKKLFKPGNWKYTREMVAWGSKGGKKDEREGVPVIPTE